MNREQIIQMAREAGLDPDLEWIINANNFAKIIDGKYAK